MNTYSIEAKVPGRERLEQIAEQVLEKYYGEKITAESRERWQSEVREAYTKEITLLFKPK